MTSWPATQRSRVGLASRAVPSGTKNPFVNPVGSATRLRSPENVSLIALVVHLAVGADGGNLDQYRRRMFTAWHEETGRLATEDIVGFGRGAGMGGWDHDRAFAALAGEHAAAKRLGVFGTPSLVLEEERTVFVKLNSVPTADRAWQLWDQVHQLALSPDLWEWHRVVPEGKGAR